MYVRRKKLRKPRKQNIKKTFISEENKEKTFISEENKEKVKDRIISWRHLENFWNRRRKKRKKRIRKKEKKYERLIKYKIIRDIRSLFEQQEEDYYKPKRVSSFWNNNYIEYESNGDKTVTYHLTIILIKLNLIWEK